MSAQPAPTAMLIVDDHRGTLQSLSLVFGRQGYQVATASTGREAVEKARQQFYNVALVDIRLPDGDGIELLGPLREVNQDLAVILMTGHASLEAALNALNRGASAFVTKPLQLEGLQATVRQVLESQRLELDNRRLFQDAQRELAERRRAEAEVRRLQDLNDGIIRNMREGIILTDDQGVIRFVNPASGSMLGYQGDDLLGQAWTSIIASGQEDLLEDASRRIHSDRAGSYELDLLRRDGSRLPVWASGTHWTAPDGGHLLRLVVFTDVSERNRLMQQSLHAQRLEAVGRLAAGLAHDLGNLMTVTQVGAGLLARRMAPDDPLLEPVLAIKSASERAAKLNKQLLTLSRMEVIQPQALILTSVVRGLEPMLQAILRPSVDLRLALEADLWPVRADPSQLERVVTNLALNARDAMPDGGTLTIETANLVVDDTFTGEVVGMAQGDYVVLKVTDTGLGMDENVRAHLFEPFFTTKAAGSGTGLGLASVYGIIRQNQGVILVESEPGQGTAFTIYLPRGGQAAAGAPAPALPEETEALRGGETILLVEDIEEVRTLSQRILEGQGYAVEAAANGDEALRISAQHSGAINLLITDMALPGMSGAQLAERLREVRPDLAVMFISGFADDATRAAVDAGATVLGKPFSISDLLRKVRVVLDAEGAKGR